MDVLQFVQNKNTYFKPSLESMNVYRQMFIFHFHIPLEE